MRLPGRAWNLLCVAFPAAWACGAVLHATGAAPGLATLGMAAAIAAMDLVLHEASHGLLVRDPTWNRRFGFLFGLPSLTGISAYRHVHARHHRQSLRTSAGEWWTNGTPLFVVHVPFAAWREGDAALRRRVATEYALIVFLWGAVTALLAVRGHGRLLVDLWLVPFAIATGVTSVRGLTETIVAALVRREEEGRAAPGSSLGLLTDHLEHHLAPNVAWYALGLRRPALREEHSRSGAGSYLRFLWDRFEARTRRAVGTAAAVRPAGKSP